MVRGRNAQVSRIYVILDALQSSKNGLCVAEIAAKLDEHGWSPSKRTIYRDIDALQASGFPLTERENDSKFGKVWILDQRVRVTEFLMLSPRELLGLYIARSTLGPIQGTPFEGDITSAFQKIAEKLGSKGKNYIGSLTGEIQASPTFGWGNGVSADLLECVHAACSERHVIETVYRSASTGVTRQRRIGPQFINLSKGSIYLVGEDMLSPGTIKIFNLSRMVSARMLDEPYSGDPVNPEEFFRNTFGSYRVSSSSEITLAFSATAAPFVLEKSWHPSQEVLSQSDKGVTVRLNVGISPELVKWILGFGADVQVLSPGSLASAIRNEAEKMLVIYSEKSRNTAA